MSTVIAKNVQVGTSGTATDNFTIFQPATPDGTLRIGNGNTGITTGLVTLNSSGNLGLGVTPSAWTTLKPIQFAGGASLAGFSNTGYLNANAYFDGSWRYIATATSGRYEVAADHKWFSAGSGTAGNAISFTQAMTLDASQRLMIGTTSSYGGNLTLIPTNGNPTTASSTLNQIAIGEASVNSAYKMFVGYLNIGGGYAGSVQAIAGGAGTNLLLNADGGSVIVGDTSSQYSAKIYANGSIAARNGGVDGTYQDAFVAGYTSNYTEKNIIQTAVSSNGVSSGFRFLTSNGAGLSTTKTTLDLTRDRITFYNDGTERARIDSGNLLVGTTNATLYNQGAGVTGLRLGGTNCQMASTGTMFDFNNTSGGGINAINWWYRGGNVGNILVNTTSTAYNTTSDYRLKEDIAPMTGALAKVAALNPCTYKWKSSGEADQGFIAHELAEVCPAAVTGEKDAVDADNNPVYQGIDTSFLVATLTAAIQELKAEFDAYKATHP